MSEPTGEHLDLVYAKMKQDELRMKNGLKPKYDQLELLREICHAAALDVE